MVVRERRVELSAWIARIAPTLFVMLDAIWSNR